MRLLDLVVAVDDAKRVRELHIALLSCEYRVLSTICFQGMHAEM
jgi:hypothetical protein